VPILPLPQFEEDLKAYHEDLATYEKLSPPKTIVLRYGRMKMIGEFPYSGDAKPGCGSKLVVKTFRGTEIGEMLTSTCPNSGCSKSVSRQDMLRYIENSGGRDYPFTTAGGVVRIATGEDLDRQASLEQGSHAMTVDCRRLAERRGAQVKIVDVEPILGQERLTVYYASEERLDLRDLHGALEDHFRAKVDLRHVGARDEARLTADYERCGQYCCCKNFLKVLKPVSMKSAKVQKATLDPLKISGRCGRLMCCLRYEDQTYDELRKRLPKRKTRVGTPEGDGLIIDTQILTQLALVLLDRDGRQVAIAIEELTPPQDPVGPPPMREGEPARAARAPGPRPGERGSDRPGDRPAERTLDRPAASPGAQGTGESRPPASRAPASGRSAPPPRPRDDAPQGPGADDFSIDDIAGDDMPTSRSGESGEPGADGERSRRRRRRRRGRGPANPGETPANQSEPQGNAPGSSPGPSSGQHSGQSSGPAAGGPPASRPATGGSAASARGAPGGRASEGLHAEFGERRAADQNAGSPPSGAPSQGPESFDDGPDGADGPDDGPGTPGDGAEPGGNPDGPRRRRRRRRRRGGGGGGGASEGASGGAP
jgi:cell fate regulator YaaT (PSP1 superfamily)